MTKFSMTQTKKEKLSEVSKFTKITRKIEILNFPKDQTKSSENKSILNIQSPWSPIKTKKATLREFLIDSSVQHTKMCKKSKKK